MKRSNFFSWGSNFFLISGWAVGCQGLGEAGGGSGDVAPLLDDRLLDLPGVGAGPRADLLGDVHALLGLLQEGHQLGHVLASLLGLQVAGLLRDLLDNGFGPVVTFLWALLQFAADRSANLMGLLGTRGLGSVLGDTLGAIVRALHDGPFVALLLSRVTVGHIVTPLLVRGFACDVIVFNVVLDVFGFALRLVHSPTFRGALAVTDQWGVAELDGLLAGNLLVLDETALLEVLLAFLLLLGLEVGGVGSVALLAVAMLALNLVIVLGLLNHHDLVDTPFASSSNVANAEVEVLASGDTGIPGSSEFLSGMGLVMLMMVMILMGSRGSLALSTGTTTVVAVVVEGEGVAEVLASTLGCSHRDSGDEHQQGDLGESSHFAGVKKVEVGN